MLNTACLEIIRYSSKYSQVKKKKKIEENFQIKTL